MLATSPAVSLKVRKRNGALVDYQKHKIVQVVKLCLVNGCKKPNDEVTAATANHVAAEVDRMIRRMTDIVSVESIQDLVILQLRLVDPEAADHFASYREEHRRMREAVSVDAVVEAAISADRSHFITDAQAFQHYDKYARFNDVARRRETYEESVDRVIKYMRWEVETRHNKAGVITEQEWDKLRGFLLAGWATPSMRMLQTAGPAATRCNVGVYNCSYCGISDLDYFHEGLYISMQGTGHAFSVEAELIEKLPQVKFAGKAKPDGYVIEDSTEGWCQSVRDLSYRLFDGHDLAMDYSGIRKAGTRLKTKGGTASGPKPLAELHDSMRRIIKGRQGKRLRDIDVHDIMCFIGRAGEMGGFRRAACLSMSDFDSMEMRMAKATIDGKGYYEDPKKIHRSMANNSAAYWDKPEPLQFIDEWVQLAKSRSGERGIFNRGSLLTHQFPDRRVAMYEGQRVLWGCNPCGEIILHPDGQFCNLSIAIVRPDDTPVTLKEKVEVAAIFGTIQSMLTNFNYLRPHWKANCERERLLGVDLLGAMDCPLFRVSNHDREVLLAELRDHAVAVNRQWAQRLGIQASTAVTCIKPGGNSSVRWNTGQSMSGWLSKHMIRNVEVGIHNPMCKFLKDQGVPHEVSYRDPDTMVFAFPLEAPDGAFIVADLEVNAEGRVVGTKPRRSAIAQLEDWLVFKKNWTEHNPSVSIYVADDEWLAVGQWVYDHWNDVGGLAFFPLDTGVYKQAPMTPVTKAQYDAFKAGFPQIQWEKLPRYDGGTDRTEMNKEKACSGDRCVM